MGHLGKFEWIWMPVSNFSGVTPSISRSAVFPIPFLPILLQEGAMPGLQDTAASVVMLYESSLVVPASLMENH